MFKIAFKRLKVGQRVYVVGSCDGKSFDGEVGTIVEGHHDDSYERLVRFDTWSDGHGVGGREWGFYDTDVKDFSIRNHVDPKPEPVVVKKKAPKGPQQYRGNGKHAWERVTGETMRLRVPGGWLYGEYSRRIDRVVNSTFVPVPQAVGYAV
jgi:hypothetical protein